MSLSEEHSPDPESAPECPVTPWEDWLPCEGECTNGKLQGYQMRFRYHLVDGVAVGKYVENVSIKIFIYLSSVFV